MPGIGPTVVLQVTRDMAEGVGSGRATVEVD